MSSSSSLAVVVLYSWSKAVCMSVC